MWWSSSDGKIELKIKKKDAKKGSCTGSCDNAIAALRQKPKIKKQLDNIEFQTVFDFLDECGPWTDNEMQDHDANLDKLLWMACCDLADMIITKKTYKQR